MNSADPKYQVEMVADYMLFAVNVLGLEDDGDTSPVFASEIYAACLKWEKCRRTSQRSRNGKNSKKTF